MARIKVEKRTMRELQQQGWPQRAGEVEKQVGAPNDFRELCSTSPKHLALFEGLHVEAPLDEQHGAIVVSPYEASR